MEKITPEEIEKRFEKLTPEEKAELIIGSTQMKAIQKRAQSLTNDIIKYRKCLNFQKLKETNDQLKCDLDFQDEYFEKSFTFGLIDIENLESCKKTLKVGYMLYQLVDSLLKNNEEGI